MLNQKFKNKKEQPIKSVPEKFEPKNSKSQKEQPIKCVPEKFESKNSKN